MSPNTFVLLYYLLCFSSVELISQFVISVYFVGFSLFVVSYCFFG